MCQAYTIMSFALNWVYISMLTIAISIYLVNPWRMLCQLGFEQVVTQLLMYVVLVKNVKVFENQVRNFFFSSGFIH